VIETLYVEEAVTEHPRAMAVRARFPRARLIVCERYGEVFNPKAQNFRLQKRRPALILAKKFKNFVLPVPAGYGIGGERNYYFSHMLNCLYDCRYCFLQGMYRSAHYVVFVNFEDFMETIRTTVTAHLGAPAYFFSGYDCDSLALEPITGFAAAFLPWFRQNPNAWIELRTKSTQIRALLDMEPFPNCVVAYSFTPDELARALEHRTPDNPRRLGALVRLQEAGWRIGLRFDPLIYHRDYAEQYRRLFETLFARLDVDRLHSVSLGVFRLPESFFRTLVKLYPQERLLAGPLCSERGIVSYRAALARELVEYCRTELLKRVPMNKLFSCQH
jgi:spore photoproduct lyase